MGGKIDSPALVQTVPTDGPVSTENSLIVRIEERKKHDKNDENKDEKYGNARRFTDHAIVIPFVALLVLQHLTIIPQLKVVIW
jgi:hypothetical protein